MSLANLGAPTGGTVVVSRIDPGRGTITVESVNHLRAPTDYIFNEGQFAVAPRMTARRRRLRVERAARKRRRGFA